MKCPNCGQEAEKLDYTHRCMGRRKIPEALVLEKKGSDNEFASNYPGEMKAKKMVSEIKKAGKFARKTIPVGTGIGKSSQPISPGKKKKKR